VWAPLSRERRVQHDRWQQMPRDSEQQMPRDRYGEDPSRQRAERGRPRSHECDEPKRARKVYTSSARRGWMAGRSSPSPACALLQEHQQARPPPPRHRLRSARHRSGPRLQRVKMVAVTMDEPLRCSVAPPRRARKPRRQGPVRVSQSWPGLERRWRRCQSLRSTRRSDHRPQRHRRLRPREGQCAGAQSRRGRGRVCRPRRDRPRTMLEHHCCQEPLAGAAKRHHSRTPSSARETGGGDCRGDGRGRTSRPSRRHRRRTQRTLRSREVTMAGAGSAGEVHHDRGAHDRLRYEDGGG
jgi:hypothetical protein